MRYTRNIPGDMAECGCYKGASAWFMAKEAPSIKLHLFDSFAGLSPPEGADITGNSLHSLWHKGALAANEEHVKNTLKDFSNIVIYKGWIPERFPEISHLKFRLVHIDVDLYQPTLDSLNFFYERLTSGGVIVLDDYGFLTCPGAYQAAQEFARERGEHILHLPTGQGVLIKKKN